MLACPLNHDGSDLRTENLRQLGPYVDMKATEIRNIRHLTNRHPRLHLNLSECEISNRLLKVKY